MITRSEWQAANRHLMADDRRRVGEPPTAEEMLAYTRGELSAEEEARVRERLVCHPDLVRTLTEPFPVEGAEPGDPDYLPDEELAKHWSSLQNRLGRGNEKSGRLLQFWRASAALAAMLALVFGWMLWEANRRASLPRVWEDQIIYPDGRRGPDSGPVALTAKGESVVLLIPLYNADYDRYRLELAEVTSHRVVWRTSAPQLRDSNSFVIVVPRRFLKPGTYQVVVYGTGPGSEQLVATYSFRVPR